MSNLPEERRHIAKCSYCGDSPVNHTITYLSQTFDGITIGISKKLSTRRWFVSLLRIHKVVEQLIAQLSYPIASLIGLVRYNTSDVTKAVSYRSRVIWEEARRRKIQMEQVLIFGVHTDIYRAKINNEWIYFESLPIPQHIDYACNLWIDDKFLLKQHLSKHKIPVPKFENATSEKEALEAFARINTSIIVKPQSGSRGRHTTTLITSVSELKKAFAIARQINRYAAIEEHLFGNVCRGTVIDGILCGFFEAESPRIIGDGKSTIAELVEQKNLSRHERIQPVALGVEHLNFLLRQGYTPDSIVPQDAVVDLTQRTGRLFGGKTRELLNSVHPKLRHTLEEAARVINAPVVGFDLIIKDPESDPDAQRWGIIEANSLPFIDLHYLPLHGEPSNPASAIWDLWGITQAK